MCYDLNEYDPFEPIILLVEDGSEYVDTEPMTDEDWEEWLEVEGGGCCIAGSAEGASMNKADDVFDIWFAYYNKEIGLHQLNRMLKDLGWTDDEIDEALADGDDDEA